MCSIPPLRGAAAGAAGVDGEGALLPAGEGAAQAIVMSKIAVEASAPKARWHLLDTNAYSWDGGPITTQDSQRTLANLAFGDLLRDYRRAADLTQEELAERAGVSPRSISELERGGAHVPRRDTVMLLARALGLQGADRER